MWFVVGGGCPFIFYSILLVYVLVSKSDLHQPLFELLNQVKLYAKTWNVNRLAMVELEKDYQRHYYVLDVAIRKLEGVESRIQRMKAQHNLSMWEKFALRVLVQSLLFFLFLYIVDIAINCILNYL